MSDFARDEELSEHEEVIEEVQERHGGPQTDDEEDDGQDDEKRKMEERERKKAEVRKRLEDSNKKKAKKGFLTPERKKKLRKLLMLKAAEDLKQQQVLKEQERKNCLEKRIIKLPANLDTIENQGELEKIAQTMVDKIKEIENTKYDLDFVVRAKDHEINELSIAVNDLRGKFVKPPLKKVSKYDNKFKKLADAQKKEEQPNFRANLKKSQDKTALLLESLTKDKKSEEAPEWAKKGSSHDKPLEEAEVEAPEEEE